MIFYFVRKFLYFLENLFSHSLKISSAFRLKEPNLPFFFLALVSSFPVGLSSSFPRSFLVLHLLHLCLHSSSDFLLFPNFNLLPVPLSDRLLSTKSPNLVTLHGRAVQLVLATCIYVFLQPELWTFRQAWRLNESISFFPTPFHPFLLLLASQNGRTTLPCWTGSR